MSKKNEEKSNQQTDNKIQLDVSLLIIIPVKVLKDSLFFLVPNEKSGTRRLKMSAAAASSIVLSQTVFRHLNILSIKKSLTASVRRFKTEEEPFLRREGVLPQIYCMSELKHLQQTTVRTRRTTKPLPP